MKIISIRSIHGPNFFHRKPVLIMKVDLELWTDQSSQEFHGFVDSLISAFPGLMQHTCSPGYVGGFYERLLRGTYLAHIIEHVAIELSLLSGIPVHYGKTVYAGTMGHYNIVVRFKNEEGMKSCLCAAFNIVESLILKSDFSVAQEIRKIKQAVLETQLGPRTQALIDAAYKRNIPVARVGTESLLRLGYGKNIRYVQAATTDRTSAIAVDLVQDKLLTKKLLQQHNIPVPEGFLLDEKMRVTDAIQQLRFPCAIKPVDGHHGQGVCLNLNSEKEIDDATVLARKYSTSVLIEEMCFGKDYRVLVVDQKVIAAARRLPPSIIGDGKSSVTHLIEKLNQDPKRAEGHLGALTKIEIDPVLLSHIKNQNAGLETILQAGQPLSLRANANLSGGGTAEDVTDLVHPEVRNLCERIARLVGLDICGIDIIHSDISKPVGNSLKVIEVNAGPGLRMHLFPNSGVARPVGEKIIDMLYPLPEKSRIPIISVTGTNGKTSTVRMLRKIFSSQPDTVVGMTSSSGVWIDNEKIVEGDTSGPGSAAIVLADPKVNLALFEVARGGLLRGGLAYDQSDIGIVTNIRPDHLGQDGIEDLEDLVRIKSLVVEHVKENGTVILNADDEQSLGLMNRESLFKVPKNIILYSLNPYNSSLVKHLNQLKDGCWLQDGIIHMMYRQQLYRIGYANPLPITMNGTAKFQISNVLAVVSAAMASGVDANEIYSNLLSFNPTIENSGRNNLYRLHQGYVLLDYAHNPDGLEAIGDMISHYKGFYKTAILGLPGDRENKLFQDSAHVAAKYFDQIVLRDDIDLRGRKNAEVPHILHETLKENYPEIKTKIIEDEKEAIEHVLGSIRKNELVVLFYDELDHVMTTLRQFDPTPVTKIEAHSESFMSDEILASIILQEQSKFLPRT